MGILIRFSFRRLFIAGAVIVLINPSLIVGSVWAAETFPEYEVKAALIAQVAKFIHWPQTSDSDSSLHVCVLGEDPFGPALDALRDKQVGGRPLTTERLQNLRFAADRCHILFISRSEKSRLTSILAKLQASPILTIADTKGFAQLGGILNLEIANDRVIFEINVRSSQIAGLRIDTRLLELVTIVGDELAGGK